MEAEGILLVNKPKGKTSFSLISALRKILNVKKIGHAGTLDPMATGVMILLVGKRYTSLSNEIMASDKEYLAEVFLGITTDTYDAEGKVVSSSRERPSLDLLKKILEEFQGSIEQIPPMFSAKKMQGRKLYQYARQGIDIERPKTHVFLTTELISYEYPNVLLRIHCSKGTYIRSIANDLGGKLGCGAHLNALIRTKSGSHLLEECLSGELLYNMEDFFPRVGSLLHQTINRDFFLDL